MALLGVIHLPSDTGMVKDEVTFQWAIGTAGVVPPTERPGIMSALRDWLLTVGVASTNQINPLTSYLGNGVDSGAGRASVKLYDITGHLDGSPHGSPIGSLGFTCTTSGSSLPTECAAVVRLDAVGRAGAAVESPDGSDADLLVDRPKQRFTGRVYFGPCTDSASESLTGGVGVGNALRRDLVGATRQLVTNIAAASPIGGAFLGVWSRKDVIIRPLESIRCDNAWDTQRRRGIAATSSTVLSVP